MSDDDDSILADVPAPGAEVVPDLLLAFTDLFAHTDQHLVILPGLHRAAGVITPRGFFSRGAPDPFTFPGADDPDDVFARRAGFVDRPGEDQS